MRRFTAMERAVTLLRDPVCVARMRNEALPSDVSTVLRVLARDAEAEAEALASTGKPLETVLEAAELYVTQVLFHSTTDPYRLLGATPNATRAELRSNLALLLRWLHPDIAGPRHRGMTERVIKAWNELKTEDTRHALDEVLARRRDNSRNRRAESPRRPRSALEHKSQQRRPARHAGSDAHGSQAKRKRVILIALAAMVGAGLICYLPTGSSPLGADILAALFQSNDSGARASGGAEAAADTSKTAVGRHASAVPKCAACGTAPAAAPDR